MYKIFKKKKKKDNTERNVEDSGGIIHLIKNEKRELLQSEQEQRSKLKIHQVVLKAQSHSCGGK